MKKNKATNYYRKCYSTCRSCEKAGSETNNECLSCDIDKILNKKGNCIKNCKSSNTFNLEDQCYLVLINIIERFELFFELSSCFGVLIYIEILIIFINFFDIFSIFCIFL